MQLVFFIQKFGARVSTQGTHARCLDGRSGDHCHLSNAPTGAAELNLAACPASIAPGRKVTLGL